jgi:hypothetical protein
MLECPELVRQAEKERESIKEKEKLCPYCRLLMKRNSGATPREAAPPGRGDTLLAALLKPPKPCKSSSTEKGALLLRKAVDLALEGDKIALRLCLERLLPPPARGASASNVPKLQRATDIAQALGLLLDSVACGDLTPAEGHHLAALLEIQRKAIEMAELEPRITRLERYKDAHPL